MLFLYMYIIDFLFEFMPTFAFSTTVHSSESVVWTIYSLTIVIVQGVTCFVTTYHTEFAPPLHLAPQEPKQQTNWFSQQAV